MARLLITDSFDFLSVLTYQQGWINVHAQIMPLSAMRKLLRETPQESWCVIWTKDSQDDLINYLINDVDPHLLDEEEVEHNARASDAQDKDKALFAKAFESPEAFFQFIRDQLVGTRYPSCDLEEEAMNITQALVLGRFSYPAPSHEGPPFGVLVHVASAWNAASENANDLAAA